MGVESNETPRFFLGDKAYDLLTKLVQLVLPAIGSAYVVVAQAFGLPVEAVLSVLVIATTVLGVVLRVSSAQYRKAGEGYDGTVTAIPGEDSTTVRLSLDPQRLVARGSINLKVVSPPEESLPSE